MRPKRSKLAEKPELAEVVAGKLRLLWSPDQIAGWLRQTCPRRTSTRARKPLIRWWSRCCPSSPELKQNVIFTMEEPETALPSRTHKCIINGMRD